MTLLCSSYRFGGLFPLVAFLASLAASSAQGVVLNELVSGNSRGLVDESGGTPDWVELFNPGNDDVRLAGYGLSDDPALPFKWVISNATLRPQGFLVVYADGKDRQSLSHPALTPDQIPGLAAWFKASDVVTNDTASVRKSGAALYLRRWNDGRGNGQAFNQTLTSQQPLFTPASANGLLPATVRFDGNDDGMLLGAPLGTNDFSIVFVARGRATHEVDSASASGTGGTSGQRYLFGANHGGTLDSGMGLSMGTNGVSVYEHGDGYMPALAVMTGSFGSAYQVLGVRYRDKTPDLFWQGILASVGFRSPRAQVFAPTSLGSGAYGAWPGDLAELLIFRRALSDAEMLGLQRFLLESYRLLPRSSLHASFALGSGGESVVLTRPDGSKSDEIRYPGDLPRDVSYGRKLDGIGPWAFFQSPTPGASNLTVSATELLGAPSFSHPSGAYSNAFLVTLSVTNQGAIIRYTLDGSEPSTKSLVYTAPLLVTNRATLPNVLSLIPTVPGGIAPPTGLVNKLTVVRARAFKEGGLSAPSATRSYLIHPKGGSRYSMPVVSLVSDRANFFDDNVGIYVPGNAAGGNYAQSGDLWERPGHVDLFETNGVAVISQGTGIRMHGNTSFYFPVKGLRLHPLNFPGTGPFEYRIFPERPVTRYNRLLLRPSGHDYNLTMFRDIFMQSLGAELGLDTQAYRPAVLFINGEYWGIHHLQEAFEGGYFAAHQPGVDPDNVDYLEGFASAVEGDGVRWSELMSFLQTHDLTDPGQFAQVRDFMQVENFGDFKICEIYYYRWDIGNHRLWRPRTPEGRFRWILFDCDVGWGGFWAVPPAWSFPMLNYDLEANGPWTQYSSNPGGNDHNSPVVTYLLRTLLTNQGFRRDWINRWADLLNTTFHTNHVLARIDSFATQLAPEMREHVDRWHAPSTLSEWSNQVRVVRDFAVRRPAAMRQQLASRFGLAGSVVVRLAVDELAAGAIRLNSIDVSASVQAPWTGVYFKGHPVTATAIANPGYRFVGWRDRPGAAQTLNLTPDQDLALTALFVLDPSTLTQVPKAWPLADGPYLFERWAASEPAGSYPPHMRFQQTPVAEPVADAAFDDPWTLPYDRPSRSRVLGLGEEGVGFLNTSDSQLDGGGYVGAAVLGLNTLGVTQAQIQFTAGTVLTNSRSYALRLQYRIGNSGAFTDWTDSLGRPISYERAERQGHARVLGPYTLPAVLLNRPYVQIRWVYHHVSGVSGPRAELRLDDVLVAAAIPVIAPAFSFVRLEERGAIRLGMQGRAFGRYLLEASADLEQWTVSREVTLGVSGRLEQVDATVPAPSMRFYRIRAE